jgi:hypothetical protein
MIWALLTILFCTAPSPMPPLTLQFPKAMAATPFIAYHGANLQRSAGSRFDLSVDLMRFRAVLWAGFQTFISFRDVGPVSPEVGKYSEGGERV